MVVVTWRNRLRFLSNYGYAYLKDSSQFPIELLFVVTISFLLQNMDCGYLKELSQFSIKIKFAVTWRNRLSFLSKRRIRLLEENILVSYQNKGCSYLKEPSQFPLKYGYAYLKEPSQFPITIKIVAI